jgi:O-antigen/teichoic acid export membrane protein
MNVELSNRDYIWSYLGVFLSLVSNIVITPFVMYFLDSDSFGVWSVFISLGAITTLFDFGFSATFARNINYCWNGASVLKRTGAQYSSGDSVNYQLMKKTIISCRIVFLILSLIAFSLLISLGSMYIVNITRSIEGYEAIIAWFIYAVAIFLNLYFGYYSAFLKGVGDIADANKVIVIAKLIQIILTIVLLMANAGLIGIAIAYLIYVGIIFRTSKKFFLQYKEIGENLKMITEKVPIDEVLHMFCVVWHNAWREGLVSFSNYLANQACTIICSLYMPLSQTGAYSLAVQLATAVSQISASMYTANQPVLQSSYIHNDKEKTKSVMSLIVFSFVILNIIGLIIVIMIGLPILRLIKPESVVSAYMMIGIGCYQFILKFRNCYTSYFSCTNRIPYVKSFIVSAICCVLFSYLAIGYFQCGMVGLVIAQILSQCIYNVWAWPLKVHKELGLSVKKMMMLGNNEFKKVVVSIIHNALVCG